jgi:hypothetical protein
MAHHVSTKQILEFIKTAKKISVDGIIYENFSLDDTNITVDKHVFPLDWFDAGGMDYNSLILIDTSHEWRRVQMHDENDVTLTHPPYDGEPYDITRVRHSDLISIANQTQFNK